MIDSSFAESLSKLLVRTESRTLFSRQPICYYPIVVAHCQQAIEKSLKAMLCVVEGRSPKLLDHNPLAVIWDRQTRTRTVLRKHGIIRPPDVDVAARILRLAPGASITDRTERTVDNLLRQRNTEYPFESVQDGGISLPYQSITEYEVMESLRFTGPLLLRIKKYISGNKIGLLD
jgi:hypothetical protein